VKMRTLVTSAVLTLSLLASPLFAATHQISILGPGTKPDTSGEVFFEPYDVTATNDVWDRLIVRFGASITVEPTTRIGLHGGFVVPQNYVDTANLVIVWTSTITADDVEWDFDYRTVAGNDTTSLDQAGTEETVNGNDVAPSATDERMEFTIALTDGNFTAGDEVTFTLFRDGTDAGDTLNGTAVLFSLLFEYNDA